MPLIPPHQAIYPKSKIKNVTVLHDGTQPPFNEFSIAELEFHDGSKAIGIRNDRNDWNENTEEKGYPVVRGGLPSWFVLPKDIKAVAAILSTLELSEDTKPLI